MRSERLPERNVQHTSPLEYARHELARREVEPELHPHRPDWRAIENPEARGGTQIYEAQVAGVQKDIARIDEGDRGESLHRVDAQFGVEDHLAVATLGEAGLRIDGFRRAETIEREPADRGVAAGEKALTGGQVLYLLRDGCAGLIDRRHQAGEAVSDANPLRRCDNDAATQRQPDVLKGLTERLHETDFGSDRTRADVAVQREKQTARWVE